MSSAQAFIIYCLKLGNISISPLNPPPPPPRTCAHAYTGNISGYTGDIRVRRFILGYQINICTHKAKTVHMNNVIYVD